MPSTRYPLAFYLVAIGIGTLGSLLLAETSLQANYFFRFGRFYWPSGLPPIWEQDSTVGFKVRRNVSVTHTTPEFSVQIYSNSQGFRVDSVGREYDTRKSDQMRLMTIGSSFAFGWGVDFADVWLEQLSNDLALMRGHPVETINAGVPSRTDLLSYHDYRTHGYRYGPDLLFIVNYRKPIAGDLDVERVASRYSTTAGGHLVHGSSVPRPFSLRRIRLRITRQSLLWALAAHVAKTRLLVAPGRDIFGQPFAWDSGYPAQLIEANIRMYSQFDSLVSSTGAIPVWIYAPASYEVHPHHEFRWSQISTSRERGGGEFYLQLLAKAGAEFAYDLTPCLREKGSERDLYYLQDIHWNNAGNKAVSECIQRYIMATPAVRKAALN